MANGQIFNPNNFTCASRLFPLGSVLYITNIRTGKTIRCVVTDKISKKYAKTRIDLTPRAFSELADLKQGIIQVWVERR
jgi:rare lipoprotein A